MSSEPRKIPARGMLEYFLSSRARTHLAVIDGDPTAGLEEAMRSGKAAALLLGDEEPEAKLLAAAVGEGMAILGPASLGVIVPPQGLRFTRSKIPVHSGKVAFVTQSAALGAAILDWSQKQKVGFSAFLSLGRAATLGLGEVIDYLAEDPLTKSILLYVETIPDARAFLSAARECALSKPIIVLRAGRQDRQQDAVYDAAFRRSGVLRVQRLAELFYLAEVLDRQPRPEGDRLAIVTNARGPALLAGDSLRLLGGGVAEVADVGTEAKAEDYGKEFDRLFESPDNDGVLAILTPEAAADPTATASLIKTHAAKRRKPVLASFLGADLVSEANEVLAASNVAAFPYPDTAARAFHTMWQYSSNLRALYETPIFPAEMVDASAIEKELRECRERGRETLDLPLLTKLLEAYGIPLDAREAKVTQPFRLRSEVDAGFGPVLYLGAAGFGEEIYGDLTAALPPLTSTLARRFVERLKIHQAFRDATLRSLEVVLVRFSRMVTELPILRQVEISPLCAESGIVWAGGARASLQPRELDEAHWPRSVIRPYPAQYVTEIELRDGSMALLRPIRPEDERLIIDFHNGLSERSVYMRYMQFLKHEERVLHERLVRVCFNDYARELALVVEQAGRILGVGRLQRNPLRQSEAEVAFLVRDSEQGKGIGKALVENLVSVAKAEGLRRLTAELLSDNTPMRHLLERVGFVGRLSADGQTLIAAMSLEASPEPRGV